MAKKGSRYAQIFDKLFADRFQAGQTEVGFVREDIEKICVDLGIPQPKNLGDVIYSFRHRVELPENIQNTAPEGFEWIIEGDGRAQYKFKLHKISRILPREDQALIKIPDATPEIISLYSLSDEQALLAKLRYNRLIDIFLGITVYSLQNHLRTTVPGIGQIEIDEVYIGVDRSGAHYVVPIQAKGGKDSLGVVQTLQDYEFCRSKYPNLIPRMVSAQFVGTDQVALFELIVEAGELKVKEEKHYHLVEGQQITSDDLKRYGLPAP